MRSGLLLVLAVVLGALVVADAAEVERRGRRSGWSYLMSRARTVSCKNANELWVLRRSGRLYRYEGGRSFRAVSTQGRVQSLATGCEGQVAAVAGSGRVYIRSEGRSAQWSSLAMKGAPRSGFRTVALGKSGQIVALSRRGVPFHYDATTSAWSRIARNKLRAVSISCANDGALYALRRRSGRAVVLQNGKFHAMRGSRGFSTLSASSPNNVYGTTRSGRVYRWSTGVSGGRWSQVRGLRLHSLDVGTGGMACGKYRGRAYIRGARPARNASPGGNDPFNPETVQPSRMNTDPFSVTDEHEERARKHAAAGVPVPTTDKIDDPLPYADRYNLEKEPVVMTTHANAPHYDPVRDPLVKMENKDEEGALRKKSPSETAADAAAAKHATAAATSQRSMTWNSGEMQPVETHDAPASPLNANAQQKATARP